MKTGTDMETDSLVCKLFEVLCKNHSVRNPNPVSLKSVSPTDPQTSNHQGVVDSGTWFQSVTICQRHAYKRSQHILYEDLCVLETLFLLLYERVMCSTQELYRLLFGLSDTLRFRLPDYHLNILGTEKREKVSNRFEAMSVLVLLTALRIGEHERIRCHPLFDLPLEEVLNVLINIGTESEGSSVQDLLVHACCAVVQCDKHWCERLRELDQLRRQSSDVKGTAVFEQCWNLCNSILWDLTFVFSDESADEGENLNDILDMSKNLYSVESLGGSTSCDCAQDLGCAFDILSVSKLAPLHVDIDSYFTMIKFVFSVAVGELSENLTCAKHFAEFCYRRSCLIEEELDAFGDQDRPSQIIEELKEFYPQSTGEVINKILSSFLMSGKVLDADINGIGQERFWLGALAMLDDTVRLMSTINWNDKDTLKQLENGLGFSASFAELFSLMLAYKPKLFFEIADGFSEAEGRNSRINRVALCSVWVLCTSAALTFVKKSSIEGRIRNLAKELAINSARALASASKADRSSCLRAAASTRMPPPGHNNAQTRHGGLQSEADTWRRMYGPSSVCFISAKCPSLVKMNCNGPMGAHLLSLMDEILTDSNSLHNHVLSLMLPAVQWIVQIIQGNRTRDQVIDVREAFSILDADGDGILTKHELKDAARVAGIPISDETLDGIVKSIDADSSGEIEQDELVQFAYDTIVNSSTLEGQSELHSFFKHLVQRSPKDHKIHRNLTEQCISLILRLLMVYTTEKPIHESLKGYICWEIVASCINGINNVLDFHLDGNLAKESVIMHTREELLVYFFRTHDIQKCIVANVVFLPLSMQYWKEKDYWTKKKENVTKPSTTSSETETSIIPCKLSSLSSIGIFDAFSDLLFFATCEAAHCLENFLMTEVADPSEMSKFSSVLWNAEGKTDLLNWKVRAVSRNFAKSTSEDELFIFPIIPRKSKCHFWESISSCESGSCVAVFVGALAVMEHNTNFYGSRREALIHRLQCISMDLVNKICLVLFSARNTEYYRKGREHGHIWLRKNVRSTLKGLFGKQYDNFINKIFCCESKYGCPRKENRLIQQVGFAQTMLIWNDETIKAKKVRFEDTANGYDTFFKLIESEILNPDKEYWKHSPKVICCGLSLMLVLWDLAENDKKAEHTIIWLRESDEFIWKTVRLVLETPPNPPQDSFLFENFKLSEQMQNWFSFESAEVPHVGGRNHAEYCYRISAYSLALQLLCYEVNGSKPGSGGFKHCIQCILESVSNSLNTNCFLTYGTESVACEQLYNNLTRTIKAGGVYPNNVENYLRIGLASKLPSVFQSLGKDAEQHSIISYFRMQVTDGKFSYGIFFEADTMQMRNHLSIRQEERLNGDNPDSRRWRAQVAMEMRSCLSSIHHSQSLMWESWSNFLSSITNPRDEFCSIVSISTLHHCKRLIERLKTCSTSTENSCRLVRVLCQCLLYSLRQHLLKTDEHANNMELLLEDIMQVVTYIWNNTTQLRQWLTQPTDLGNENILLVLATQIRDLALHSLLVAIRAIQRMIEAGKGKQGVIQDTAQLSGATERKDDSFESTVLFEGRVRQILGQCLPLVCEQLQSAPVSFIHEQLQRKLYDAEQTPSTVKDYDVTMNGRTDTSAINSLFTTSVAVVGCMCQTLEPADFLTWIEHAGLFHTLSRSIQSNSRLCSLVFQRCANDLSVARTIEQGNPPSTLCPIQLLPELSEMVHTCMEQSMCIILTCLQWANFPNVCSAMLSSGLVNSLLFTPLWSFMDKQLGVRFDEGATGSLVREVKRQDLVANVIVNISVQDMFDPKRATQGFGLGPSLHRGYDDNNQPCPCHSTWCLTLRFAELLLRTSSEACLRKSSSPAVHRNCLREHWDPASSRLPNFNSDNTEKYETKMLQWMQETIKRFISTHKKVLLSAVENRMLTIRSLEELRRCIALPNALVQSYSPDAVRNEGLLASIGDDTWELVQACEFVVRDLSLLLGDSPHECEKNSGGNVHRQSSEFYLEHPSVDVNLARSIKQREELKYHCSMCIYPVSCNEDTLNKKLKFSDLSTIQSAVRKVRKNCLQKDFYLHRLSCHFDLSAQMTKSREQYSRNNIGDSWWVYPFEHIVQADLTLTLQSALEACASPSCLSPTFDGALFDSQMFDSDEVNLSMSLSAASSSRKSSRDLFATVANLQRQCVLKNCLSANLPVNPLDMKVFGTNSVLERIKVVAKSKETGPLVEKKIVCGDSDDETCMFESKKGIHKDVADTTLLKHPPQFSNLLCILDYCMNVVRTLHPEEPHEETIATEEKREFTLEAISRRALFLLLITIDKYIRWCELSPRDASHLLWKLIPHIGDDGIEAETITESQIHQKFNTQFASSAVARKHADRLKDLEKAKAKANNITASFNSVRGSTARLCRFYSEEEQGSPLRNTRSGLSMIGSARQPLRGSASIAESAYTHTTSTRSSKIFSLASRTFSANECIQWKSRTIRLKQVTGDPSFVTFAVRYMIEGLRWRLIPLDELYFKDEIFDSAQSSGNSDVPHHQKDIADEILRNESLGSDDNDTLRSGHELHESLHLSHLRTSKVASRFPR